MHVSNNCIELIKHFEGCKLKAYPDAKGIWTIGFGATFYENGRKVMKGDTITQERAESLLKAHLIRFEQIVLEKVKRPLKQQEFDAAVSFCYNAGTSYKTKGGTWKDYDLWKNITNNLPEKLMKEYWEGLAITSGGVKLNGLVRRRKSEVCNHAYRLSPQCFTFLLLAACKKAVHVNIYYR